MAILRTLDHFFGSLELARRYSALFALGEADLAARGLTQEMLRQSYLDEVAALDAAAAASRDRADRLPAAA